MTVPQLLRVPLTRSDQDTSWRHNPRIKPILPQAGTAAGTPPCLLPLEETSRCNRHVAVQPGTSLSRDIYIKCQCSPSGADTDRSSRQQTMIIRWNNAAFG